MVVAVVAVVVVVVVVPIVDVLQVGEGGVPPPLLKTEHRLRYRGQKSAVEQKSRRRLLGKGRSAAAAGKTPRSASPHCGRFRSILVLGDPKRSLSRIV